MQSGLTRRTVRPLSVRTAGGIRTRDLQVRQKAALSTELQRYARRKVVSFRALNFEFAITVDKSDTLLIRQKAATN